jgi:hypothetical protein
MKVMQRKQTLRIECDTPTLGWKLDFISVHEDKDKIVAVARLHGGSPCEAIGHSKATLEIDQAEMNAKPVQYFMLAKRQGWWTKGKNFKAISDVSEISNLTENMRQVYSVDDKELVNKLGAMKI